MFRKMYIFASFIIAVTAILLRVSGYIDVVILTLASAWELVFVSYIFIDEEFIKGKEGFKTSIYGIIAVSMIPEMFMNLGTFMNILSGYGPFLTYLQENAWNELVVLVGIRTLIDCLLLALPHISVAVQNCVKHAKIVGRKVQKLKELLEDKD